MHAAMTRHPRDVGLPQGGTDPSHQFNFPALSGESSASTIMSPLSLPHGVSGYFDYPVNNRPNREHSPAMAPRSFHTLSHTAAYSPLSPGARGPAVPQTSQFLSPNLHPITQGMQYQIHQHHQQQQQQRSASMSPTRCTSGGAGTLVRSRSTVTSPSKPTAAVVSLSPTPVIGMPPNMLDGSIPPITSASAGHPRSVSDGAAGGPSHVHMIRRLVQQNARIREAWEAERKYMEANRERVEEVYKEERALMEEDRVEWEYEKEALLKKIGLLQQQVAGLCGYRGSKDDVSTKGNARYAAGGEWNMSPESMRSSASSQGSALPGLRTGGWVGSGELLQRVSSLPPQPISDAASLALLHKFGQQAASRFSPSRQPDSSPFIPVTNNNGMASPPKADSTPVPILDVREIIPTSEGISLKVSAVQKTTFSDGPSPPPASKPTSRTPSPPADASNLAVPGRPLRQQTLQVLAAAEVDRLTMHAGHTPNHSISVLPTVAGTTASSSGQTTPRLQHGDLTDSSAAASSSSEPIEPPTTRKSETSDDDSNHPEEAGLDADTDDKPLRGPLMVRNMPAHDEIFFRRLSDKLEEVSKEGSKASVPAVLRDVVDINDSSDTKHTDSVDEVAEKTKSDNSDEQQIDVPLKLKRNNNFGAPFGEYR